MSISLAVLGAATMQDHEDWNGNYARKVGHNNAVHMLS
jgi:hypothetical protein